LKTTYVVRTFGIRSKKPARRNMEKSNNLEGQIALVTGAARGIGKAISLSLAAAGASIALVDILQEEGEKVAFEIAEKGSRALFIRCDLKNENDIVTMANRTIERFGRIDILVNNAGVGYTALTWETPTEVWEEIMTLNLRGTFLCSKYVVPHMMKQKSGRIINISSALGKQAAPLRAAYSVSKAGIIALTVALAKEVAEHGITVNAVCPGPVETPIWDKRRKSLAQLLNVPEGDVVKKIAETEQIIKILLKPEDIANVVYWLASSETTRLMTGQAISIDGGQAFPTY
jgi:NAD(P)-dependent dehydrogenase (short-subunit alcohol dehydrogenase family)